MHRWRTCVLLLMLVVLLPLGSEAGSSKVLTADQSTALGVYIQAQPDLQPYLDPPQDQAIADLMNMDASPDFWVWRTAILPEEYTGVNSIIWTAVDTLSAGKARIFDWMTAGLTRPIDASDDNKRTGVSEAFGAGSTTLANFLVLAREKASRAERIFATGTGGTTPATVGKMVWEGRLSRLDVAKALGRNPGLQP